MRVDTPFRILGYPGFAMLLFGAALVGAVLLLVDIVTHDRWHEKPTEGGR
jgi:ubiquinone biosynthesis protein